MKKDIGLINVIVFSAIIIFIVLFLVSGVSSFGPSHAYVAGACNDMTDSLRADLESGKEQLTYECFGAVGDGVHNDFEAIKKTHDFANKEYYEKGIYLTVYGNPSANYRIIDGDKTVFKDGVLVATDTNWKGANFTIDDNPNLIIDNDDNESNDLFLKSIFRVTSPMHVEACSMLDFVKDDKSSACTKSNTNMSNINKIWNNITVNSGTSNIKTFVDNVLGMINTDSKIKKYYQNSQVWAISIIYDKKQFIRVGGNADLGKDQIDTFLVNSKNGNVLTDIEWSYPDANKILEVRVWPIPEKRVVIQNGNFTTWTNDRVVKSDGSKYAYTQRGIYVAFTGNVLLKNINHYLNENKYPNNSSNQPVSTANSYYGFIRLYNASNVELNNVALTPHTVTNVNGTPYGTYDLTYDYCNNIFLNHVVYSCNETNSDGTPNYNSCYNKKMVNDSVWGIIGSNGSKNVFIRDSKLNRIDAHRGVHNLLIEDSVIGSKGLTLIGSGEFYGNNLKFDRPNHIISLRSDYGSTWNGNVALEDITYIMDNDVSSPVIIESNTLNDNNYGYQTFFPALYLKKISIDDTTYSVNKDVTVVRLNSDVKKSSDEFKNRFFGNIHFTDVKFTGNSNKLALFSNSFVGEKSNLSMNSYAGNNVVGVGFTNNDSNFTYTLDPSLSSNLTNASINTKFSFNTSSSVTSTIDNGINVIKNRLQTQENKAKMPEPLASNISISNIQVSNGNTTIKATNNGDGTFTVGVPDGVNSVGVTVQTSSNVLHASYPQSVNFSGDSATIDITIYGVYATHKTYHLNIVRSSTFTKIAPPTNSSCKANLVYNGSEQVLTGAAGEGYEFTNNKKTNAGTHLVTVQLKTGYQWNDETTADKTISCIIGKADASFTVSSTSFELKKGDSANYILRSNVKGKFVNTSSDEQIISVTPSNTLDVLANSNSVATIKALKAGRGTVSVSFTPDDTENYNIPLGKEISVNVLEAGGSGDGSGDETPNPSDNGANVPIPNTHLNKSFIIIIIGLSLVVAGSIVIIHVYNQKKRTN